MPSERPPAAVLAAFGASGELVRLEGGEGRSWRAGELVLKPLDVSEQELEWLACMLGSISRDGFRVAEPRRGEDGSLAVAGWCAWEAVAGRHERRRWPEIIAVGECFHAALAGIPCPDFIERRQSPWAVGDRVAWGELPGDELAEVKHLHRLLAALRPVDGPSQLIHGDLTGNVLFDEGLAPAIIDVSAYWRPTPFASAIVVADALVWEGAHESLLDAVAHIDDFEQYLLRALIYRAVTDRLFRMDEPLRPDDADPYLPAVELACGLVA